MQRYSADRPVEHRSEDQLGRRRFAEAIANAFVTWREDVSVVVALNGAWGSGKTSIKNFVVDALQSNDGPKRADVIEIRPWEVSGTRDLEALFFERIGSFLGRKDATKRDQQIAQWWRTAAAGLGIGESVAAPLVRPAAHTITLLGFVALFIGAEAIESTAWTLTGAAVVLLGYLLGTVRTFAERVAEFFRLRSEHATQSLARTKKELADLLRGRELPLVVIIDEIDRLNSADEMRLIFRLVKANGDLPRMLYLLVFERAAVARSLDPDNPERGEEYLEKVVQAPFDMPAVQRPLLANLLKIHIREVLSQIAVAPWDERRWLDLYHQRLWLYFESLRDVYRFLAAFEFSIGLHRERDAFEVNALDLCALEALRLFEPKLYAAFPQAETVLTRGRTDWGSSGQSDEAKKQLLTLLDLVPAERREVVKEILSDVFPRTAWAFGGSSYHSEFDVKWAEEKRVCSGTHFWKYFYADVPAGEVRQVELNDFMRISHDRAALRTELLRLKLDGRITNFLTRLRYEERQLPPENAETFLTALFDEADDLPERVGILGTSAGDALRYVAYALVERLRKEHDTASILESVLAKTEGMHAIARWLSFEQPREDGARDTLLDPESFRRLTTAWVEKIRSAATCGTLLDQRHLMSLLYHWKEWRSADEPREWCAMVAAEPRNAAKLASRFVAEMTQQGHGSVVAFRRPYMDLKAIVEFVEPTFLERQATSAPAEALSELERTAVKLLRKAMDRRREGKPDSDRLVIMEDEE